MITTESANRMAIENLYTQYCLHRAFSTLARSSSFFPGIGSTVPKVMFIGEAPQLYKVQDYGALIKLLNEVGLDARRDCWFTHTVKYAPELGGPTPDEVDVARPFLADEIKILNPQIVCLMGRFATNLLFPSLRVARDHGQVHTLRGRAYMPMFHPAVGLYNDGVRASLREDFETLRRSIR